LVLAESHPKTIHKKTSFTMQANIRNQGMTIFFRDLMIDIPKYYYRHNRQPVWMFDEYYGGYSVPVTEKGDYGAAERGMLEIVGKLEGYLKRNPGN